MPLPRTSTSVPPITGPDTGYTLYVATASYSKWMPSFVCCCSFIVTSTFTMPVPCAGAMQ